MLSLEDLQFQAEGKVETLKEEGAYRNFSVINRQAGSYPVAKLRTRNNELRLPSFSGHPISADLMSVREDVHCESTTPEIHT